MNAGNLISSPQPFFCFMAWPPAHVLLQTRKQLSTTHLHISTLDTSKNKALLHSLSCVRNEEAKGTNCCPFNFIMTEIAGFNAIQAIYIQNVRTRIKYLRFKSKERNISPSPGKAIKPKHIHNFKQHKTRKECKRKLNVLHS